MYGAGLRSEEEGGKQMALSRVLPLLRRVSELRSHCARILKNTIRQVGEGGAHVWRKFNFAKKMTTPVSC